MTDTTTNTSVDDFVGNIWDTRDLVDLIASLEAIDERDEDETIELERAKALESEIEPYAADYRYGAVVIQDDYFQEYAAQLAEDVGYLSGGEDNPLLSCIDWGRWADLVKQDYTSFDFEGYMGWVR